MYLRNFTVKGQLSASFCFMAAMVLIVSVLAVTALSKSFEGFTRYSHVDVAQAQLVSDVSGAVNRRAVAARNLVLVDNPQDVAIERQAVVTAHQDTLQALAKLNDVVSQDSNTTDQARRLVQEINRVESLYGPVALDIVKLAVDGKKDEATAKMNKECRPLLSALLKASKDYLEFSNTHAHDTVVNAGDDYARTRMLLISASVLAISAALLLGFFITRHLVGSLGGEPGAAADLARSVAGGDLTTTIVVRDGDTRSLMAQLKIMQTSLVNVVSQVRHGAENVTMASAEIAKGNHDLSGRTEQQASALEQTAASMEELSSTVKHNADSAREANQQAVNASSVATQGGQVVGRVVETMKEINDSSKKIAEIISVIDGIAFQTNILALNAAVEAARAGEQGRGFAVVASEVRSLAQRSATAAKEIKTLIDASVQQVEQGTALVATAGTTMSDVVTSIRRVADIIGEVSAASGEQSQGVSQVGQAVAQMDQVTQQNAALVEESAAAASSLSEQAQRLLQAVEVFKLDASADTARSAANGPQIAHAATFPRVHVPRGAGQVAAQATGKVALLKLRDGYR